MASRLSLRHLCRPSSSMTIGQSSRTPLLHHPSSTTYPSSTALRALALTRSASTETSQHAISNPTLADIEKRWEGMPPQEQANLWMALRDRMKSDWHDLTLQERKAAYWVAFGPHGPRSVPPPGESWYVFKATMVGVAISSVIFVLIRMAARPPPKTMNAQYQEMSNEFLRSQNVEPITGLSSENYQGKGMVQSKPRKGGIPEDEE